MNNQIIIQVYNTMGASIAKLKDYLQLSIQIPPLYKDKMILNCYEEREGGIYVFNIEDFINPFARVFVSLKQYVLLEKKMLTHYENIDLTYTSYILKEPYCLHPECSQINFVETMCNTSKPTPFTFNTTQNKVNIGIIRAYKKDINSNTFLQNIALNNEIYTLDIKQRMQLQAFIYERQKTYVREVSDIHTQTRRNHFLEQGNITKTILTPSLKETSKIKWAFKVVSQSYHGKNTTTGRLKNGSKNQGEPFVPAHLQFLSSSGTHTKYVYKKEDIVNIHQILDSEYYVLLNEEGSCIDISLEDLFTETILTSLIDKNIIFFAFTDKPQYHFYSKKNDIVLQDRTTSIELKILKTRFSFEFDGQTLSLFENQRRLGRWEARSGMALKNFPQDSKENQQRQRFSLPYKDNTSFYYDLNLHTQNTKPMDEGHYMVQFNPQNINAFLSIYDNNDKEISHIKPFKEENLNALDIKIFDENENFFTSLLQILMQDKKNDETIQIPLKIKYQKRILMLIQRFHQTPESTKARVNIFIDGKRIDEKGKLTNESFNSLLNETNPYAYILERPGPDSIAGELKLRIPEGRYDAILQKSSKLGETLNLYNDFVHQNRNILIHNGNSPKDSEGCLLINHNEIFKNNTPLDNILHIAKKDKLIKDMKKLFKSLNTNSNSFDNFVKEHIEVRIENWFKEEKIPILSKAEDRKQSIINDTSAIFNIEGYEKNSSGSIPWYQKHNFEEVAENSEIIDKVVNKNIEINNINYNRLVRAIMYLETTHGYYDIINPLKESFRPMNINYNYWEKLIAQMGYTKEQVENNKEVNIIVGYELLKRIVARIKNPSVEKIGTLYNALGKEKISSYGRVLRRYYNNKSWLLKHM